jgi:hypothetical protein
MAQNAYTFRYSLRTWHTDNQALVVRGGMTFWIDEAARAPAVYPLLAHGVKVHPLALLPHSPILLPLMVLPRDQKEIVPL